MSTQAEFINALMSLYSVSIYALFALFSMVFLQSLVAMVAHRKQAHYVPGILDEKLGQESFVFRSHRTFLNSLENLPLMVFPALVAMLSGFSPVMLAWLMWSFVIARLVHMVLYYRIATEANPSPRSYFFVIALLANLVLLVSLGIHLF